MSDFKRVERWAEYPDTVFYKTTCACGCNGLTMVFSSQDEILSLYFDVSANVPYYGERNWFIIFWKRIVAAVKCLLGYELEYNEELIFSDHEHVNDFISALQEGAAKTRAWSQRQQTFKDGA